MSDVSPEPQRIDVAPVVPKAPDLLELMEMPEPQTKTVTMVFEAKGRQMPFTVNVSAMDDAEQFFRLSAILSKNKDSKETLKVTLNQAQVFTVRDANYLGSLALLQATMVEPAWSMQQWALFGRKFGGKIVADLTSWVIVANGLNDTAITEAQTGAGEDTGAEA